MVRLAIFFLFACKPTTAIGTAQVDSSTQQILVSFVSLDSTCATQQSAVKHVVEMDGVPHLSVEVTNREGTCQTVCGMSWSIGFAVAVDNDQVGTACARRRDTCL